MIISCLKNKRFQKLFQENHQASNSFDQAKPRHLIKPDLGSNCLQWLSADDKSRQGVKHTLTGQI